MPAETVERFEAAAGELLNELDYLRAIPRLQPEALRHASQTRTSLAQDPIWSKLVLPSQAERIDRSSTILESPVEGISGGNSLDVGSQR